MSIKKETKCQTASKFAQNLRFLRKRKGWTICDLAEKIGLSPVSISRLENGLSAPRTETLYKIAHAFGIDYETLAFGDCSNFSEKESIQSLIESMLAKAESDVQLMNEYGCDGHLKSYVAGKIDVLRELMKGVQNETINGK